MKIRSIVLGGVRTRDLWIVGQAYYILTHCREPYITVITSHISEYETVKNIGAHMFINHENLIKSLRISLSLQVQLML